MWDQLEISNRNHSQAHKLCRLATSEQIVGCTIKEWPDIAWRCAFGDLMLSCRWFCHGFQLQSPSAESKKSSRPYIKLEATRPLYPWQINMKREVLTTHVCRWSFGICQDKMKSSTQQSELDSEMKSALRFCDRYKGLVMGSTVGAPICCIEGRRRRNVTFDKHPFVWFGLHVYKNLAESMPHNHLSWFLFFVWWGPVRLPSTVRLLASPSATVIHDHDTYIMIHTSWYGMIRHDTSKPSQIAMSGAGQRCYQRHHQRDPSSKMPRRTKTIQEHLKRSSEGKGMAKLWWTLPQTFYSIWSTVLIGQMWLGI